MSRYYGMSVKIVGFPSSAIDRIKQAAKEEWPFEDWSRGATSDELSSYAEDRLCGGETEEDFTERLAFAIWQAAGAYCHVTVDATYLDDVPCESHSLDEDDYARLMAGRADASSFKEQERREAVDATAPLSMNELIALVEAQGLTPEDLDDEIHSQVAALASNVNNGGLAAQVAFLVQQHGVMDTRQLLSELLSAKASPGTPP